MPEVNIIEHMSKNKCDRCGKKTHFWIDWSGDVFCPGSWVCKTWDRTWACSDEKFHEFFEEVKTE